MSLNKNKIVLNVLSKMLFIYYMKMEKNYLRFIIGKTFEIFVLPSISKYVTFRAWTSIIHSFRNEVMCVFVGLCHSLNVRCVKVLRLRIVNLSNNKFDDNII